jgi:hypothetical protein
MIFFLLLKKKGKIFFDNPPTMKTFSILWNGGYPQTPVLLIFSLARENEPKEGATPKAP